MTEIGGTKMGVPQLGPQKFKLFNNLKNYILKNKKIQNRT